jgi:predicted MFS family arabinose efflux permease
MEATFLRLRLTEYALPMTAAFPDFPERSIAPAPGGLVFLLALGAGVGVANVYYIQPALHLVQVAFGTDAHAVGWVPTLTQIGYALGMLLLAPLGDLMDRKRLILCKAGLLTLALIASALAPNLAFLAIAGIVVGLLGSIGQDFVPVAAQLAPEAQRGRVVGTVTAGLLCGILLSRTLGGLVAQGLGWRAIYWIAAGLLLIVAAAVWRFLPRLPATAQGSYGQLLRSLATLWRQHRALRRAVSTQALLAASLGAFWSTLALMLAEPPLHLGAGVAGAFGLAGAAGALAAPLFGHLADRLGPRPAIWLGCLLVMLSFGGMRLFPGSLPLLIVGTVLFDLGVMAALVSNQTIVNGLAPSARSRLNGLLMTGAMFGVATGSWSGSWAWANFGWPGICTVGLTVSTAALARSFLR